MTVENSDIAFDNDILGVLNEINRQVKLLAEKVGGPDARVLAGLDETVKNLSTKLEALNSALGQEKEYRVEVRLEGAEGAVHDLVSRVIEEVIVRVKEENILKVTSG